MYVKKIQETPAVLGKFILIIILSENLIWKLNLDQYKSRLYS